MELNHVYEIDLTEYGGEGTIRLTRPRVTRTLWCTDYTDTHFKKAEDGSYIIPRSMDGVLAILVCTVEAPFDRDSPEAYLAYLDDLEDIAPRKGFELHQRLLETVREINEVQNNPLAV